MFIIYHSRTIFFPNDSNPDTGLCSRGTVGRRQKVTEVFNWFCYAWMNMTWCKYLQTTFVLEPPNWMRLKFVNGCTLHSEEVYKNLFIPFAVHTCKQVVWRLAVCDSCSARQCPVYHYFSEGEKMYHYIFYIALIVAPEFNSLNYYVEFL